MNQPQYIKKQVPQRRKKFLNNDTHFICVQIREKVIGDFAIWLVYTHITPGTVMEFFQIYSDSGKA